MDVDLSKVVWRSKYIYLGTGYRAAIKYFPLGGTLPEGAPEAHVFGTKTVLPVPIRDGYNFDGWYEDTEFTKGPVAEIGAYVRGDSSTRFLFYAKWTEVSEWNEPKYFWNKTATGYNSKATRSHKTDAGTVELDIATVTYAIITPATCDEEGLGRYTAEFTAAWAETQTKDEPIPKTEHDWNAPTYDWKEVQNGYECTAKRVCKHDASHVETDKATVTYAEITPATCLVNGEGRYTAKFGAAWAEAQTKDVVLTKLDHSHNGRWIYNREQHWQKCGHCGELTNVGAHTFTEWKDILRDGKVVSEHHCTVCGFSECDKFIHIDGTKKPQAGVEVNPATGAAVPAVLPAIAVLAGAAVLLGIKK